MNQNKSLNEAVKHLLSHSEPQRIFKSSTNRLDFFWLPDLSDALAYLWGVPLFSSTHRLGCRIWRALRCIVLFKHEHLTMRERVKHAALQSSSCSVSWGPNALPCEEDIHEGIRAHTLYWHKNGGSWKEKNEMIKKIFKHHFVHEWRCWRCK